MGLFDKKPSTVTSEPFRAVPYGGQRKDGGHDHRGNKGDDRTPSQRKGDAQRRGRRNSEQED